jgi:ParB family chromosome partitioning protein
MPPRAKTTDGGTKTTKTTKEKKPAAPRKAKKAKAEPGSVGLTADEVASGSPTAEVGKLRGKIEAAGGHVLASYREPFGGHWVALAALPLDKVKPTPYQRELSKAHADRLASVIPKVGRFLDPVIAVPDHDMFISPNGMHRLAALGTLGAKTAVALVMPEPEIAFRILALNTEKAHNLKDKALEVIRMSRAIAEDGARSETDVAFELEQASLVTIGICYEKNPRFSGGAYNSVVSKCESFSTEPMAKSLKLREAHADKLLELDEAVTAAVAKLKAAGFTSGYLKPIVVGRINPLRFAKPGGSGANAEKADFDKTIDKMLDGANKFDASKIRAQDVAVAAAVGGEAEG